jgi:hypothetical protein
MRTLFRSAGLLCTLALFGVSAMWAQAPTPVIFFTDITSGPNTGGQNNSGVFVTIYGKNFGATQGTSIVTVGGGRVANCPVWTSWLWYQKVTCQLGANAQTGNIVVTVNGQASNGVPFTVRSGRILFVDSVNGNDSTGDGSYAKPWKGLVKMRSSVKAGDTVYLRAGSWNTLDDNGAVLLITGISGTSTAPIAVLGYPGERAVIDATGKTRGVADTYGTSSWWTFANIEFTGASDINVYIAPEATAGARADGIRFVGNINHNVQSCPWEINGDSSSSQMLGNDIYDFALESPTTGIRGYGFYYGGFGTQSNIEIGWNKIHYDGTAKLGSRGIQMYGHCPQSGMCPDKVDEFRNVSIHDNIFKGMGRNGVLLGGSDGTNNLPFKDDNVQYIYNNVFVANGATDLDYGYSALMFGTTSSSNTGTFKVYNNTFYWNGNSPLPSPSGDIDNQGTTSIEVSNNIFYAPSNASHYCGYICYEVYGSASQMSGHNNLFYNYGNGPSWSTNSINGLDPKFINPSTDLSVADFRLQSGSPAVDTGAAIGLVKQDINGVPRPQGTAYDMGAYELFTGTAPVAPNPPTNLQVTVH